MQAVKIRHTSKWDSVMHSHDHPDHSDSDGALSAVRVRMFLPLKRWLMRRGLLQLQCSTVFITEVSRQHHCAAHEPTVTLHLRALDGRRAYSSQQLLCLFD